jgi:hypothetical protein
VGIPASKHTMGEPGWSAADRTKSYDVSPSIEGDPTIQEIADELGISVEAACALVAASLRSGQPVRSRPVRLFPEP